PSDLPSATPSRLRPTTPSAPSFSAHRRTSLAIHSRHPGGNTTGRLGSGSTATGISVGGVRGGIGFWKNWPPISAHNNVSSLAVMSSSSGSVSTSTSRPSGWNGRTIVLSFSSSSRKDTSGRMNLAGAVRTHLGHVGTSPGLLTVTVPPYQFSPSNTNSSCSCAEYQNGSSAVTTNSTSDAASS